jgi:hypothetical protein
MRSKELGIRAPILSPPPEATPNGGVIGAPSSGLRWPPIGTTPGGDGGLEGGPLAALMGTSGALAGLDVWGSNLDKIRRVAAAAPAHAASTAHSGGGGAASGGGDAAAEQPPRDAQAVPPAAEAVSGFLYIGTDREGGENEYVTSLETENEALRLRLAAAEQEVARLRAARQPAEGEASAAAGRGAQAQGEDAAVSSER